MKSFKWLQKLIIVGIFQCHRKNCSLIKVPLKITDFLLFQRKPASALYIICQYVCASSSTSSPCTLPCSFIISYHLHIQVSVLSSCPISKIKIINMIMMMMIIIIIIAIKTYHLQILSFSQQVCPSSCPI